MSSRDTSESGYMYSFIALLLVVILISLALYTLLIYPSYYSGEAAYTSLKVLTDNLALAGHVTGYTDAPGTAAISQVLPSPQARPGLCAVRLNLQLATLRMNWEPGTGDDLSQATVVMITPGGRETLPRRTALPLSRPGWSIIRKGGLLPGTNANDNDLLEPHEEFSILVSTSANLPPGTPFSVIMSMPGVRPLNIDRTVPPSLSPVMDLG